MFLLQLFAKGNEVLCAHHVDVRQGSTRPRRKAETKNRADICFTNIGHDTFLEHAGGF